jgi:hypothetical protein
MLACRRCDHQIIDQEARYCPKCGKPLPAPPKRRDSGQPISGLLLLLAALICLSPLLNLFMLSSGDEGGWVALLGSILQITTPGASVLSLYAKISTAVLMFLSLLVAVLFLYRKTKAPLACLGLFTLYAIDNLVVALWMHQVPFAHFEMVSLVTAKFLFWGLVAYCWWGYISVSPRVRATFVN